MSPLLSTLVSTHVFFKGSRQGGHVWVYGWKFQAFLETLDLKRTRKESGHWPGEILVCSGSGGRLGSLSTVTGHIDEGLFLRSQFCSIGMCVCLYVDHRGPRSRVGDRSSVLSVPKEVRKRKREGSLLLGEQGESPLYFRENSGSTGEQNGFHLMPLWGSDLSFVLPNGPQDQSPESLPRPVRMQPAQMS